MATIGSATLQKVPCRMRLQVLQANQRTIRLSQELLAGLKGV
jgi:hypothetical protein